MLHRGRLFLLGGGKRLKDCMVRIVPDYSAFWKRNDSRVTLSKVAMEKSFGIG